MDNHSHIPEIDPVTNKERLSSRYDRLSNKIMGVGVIVASGIAVYSFAFNQDDVNEQQPKLDSPVAECAFNMVDKDVTLPESELAVSKCDTLGNLSDLQIKIIATQVLEAVQQS